LNSALSLYALVPIIVFSRRRRSLNLISFLRPPTISQSPAPRSLRCDACLFSPVLFLFSHSSLVFFFFFAPNPLHMLFQAWCRHLLTVWFVHLNARAIGAAPLRLLHVSRANAFAPVCFSDSLSCVEHHHRVLLSLWSWQATSVISPL